MVNKSDLPKINELAAEYASISQAISNINGGGPITSMVIGAPPPPADGMPTGMPAQIVTTYMSAPPIMYQTIVELMQARQQSISTELSNLGVFQ